MNSVFMMSFCQLQGNVTATD